MAALESKTSYQVDVTGLFPGGEYKLMVTAWQNKSGEYAVSQPAEVTGTTSKLYNYSNVLANVTQRLI